MVENIARFYVFATKGDEFLKLKACIIILHKYRDAMDLIANNKIEEAVKSSKDKPKKYCTMNGLLSQIFPQTLKRTLRQTILSLIKNTLFKPINRFRA